MKASKLSVLALGAMVVLSGVCDGRAQIVINGVANQTNYNNSVAFNVPAQAGYDYLVLLDGNPVPTGTSITVGVDYHEIQVYRTNQVTSAVESLFRHFIVRSSERGSSESGLPPWVPYPVIPSAAAEFAGAGLRLVVPSRFPEGYPIPVVAWVVDAENHAMRVNGALAAPGLGFIGIKRGVGSGFLPADQPAGVLEYAPAIQGVATNKTIAIEAGTVWTPVSGILSGSPSWPDHSRIQVTGNLTISAGNTLTVGLGTIIRLNSGVNITNNGTLVINGTVEQPVVFMPGNPAQPWGGFIMRETTGEIIATGAIFTGSGADPNWFGQNGNPGSHRDEQGLFYVDDDQSVTLTDSAAIFLAGQLGHARGGGAFLLTRFLMQHCTTGGEYTGADFTVNDSAFIDCPDDTSNFVDGDNDALYLVSGTHGFTNTLVGWTKDDGIDSGGGGSGVFNYQNCWFEANIHEGNSLSGNGKDVRHFDGVFVNNGQGLEDGYDGPTGRVERCFMTLNLTGARFGDNYNWTYTGFLWATNSILIHNHRDVWGYNWADWTYRTGQMNVRGNFLTAPDARHPDNQVWDPVADAWRLGAYPNAAVSAVGIGLASRQLQYELDSFPSTMPVGLSTFTTNLVSVDYSLRSGTAELSRGTIEFQPGEILKEIPVQIADPASHEMVRLTLSNPDHGELSGAASAFFVAPSTNPPPVGTVLVPRGSTWKYLVTPEGIDASWNTLAYTDINWSQGPAQLGYGESDQATTIGYGPDPANKYTTTYFRRTINLTNPGANYGSLDLWLLRDDGGVVYLNGTEVFRSPNMPSGVITYDTRTMSPNGENTIDTAKFSAGVLQDGPNLVAVEIHQADADSSDLSFDLELTGLALPPSPPLLWVVEEGRLTLIWIDSSFVLEQADEVDGAWSEVPSAASPWRVPAGAGQKFFRLLKR